MCSLLFFYIIIQIVRIDSARILGIIPTAIYSHQKPFQPLWRELSLRGHQVTLVTTDPMKDASLTNLTEIDLSYTYEIYKKYNVYDVVSDDRKSGSEVADITVRMLGEASNYQMTDPGVQNLINNKNLSFDLLIVEAQTPTMMSFSWIFKCPMIGIASLDSAMHYHISLGNPVHPVLNPDYNLVIEDPENLSFKERITSFLYYVIYNCLVFYKYYPASYERAKTYFGDDLPPFASLQNNMSMLFINTNPIFQNIRPLGPNTIPIGGGIHINKPKPLPENLQNYLDEAKDGFIYFSLGTNVKGLFLTEKLQEILKAFSAIPYKVLLKTDVELENVPANVKVEKWFPQQDILRHPNIALFITHGGLQSLQEAVFNAVPLIGIPFFGDQILNVNKMVKRGYGIKVDKSEITKESFKNAIYEVIQNPKYRARAKEMSDIYKDEEVPSLQRAIWWTEYVIRHKGAYHLKSLSADMPFWKFYMLDVLGLIGSVIFLLSYTLYKILTFVVSKILRRNTVKHKVQ